MDLAESLIRVLFRDGRIRVGSSPAADIQVKDRRFFASVLRRGSLGLGESYMQGWWECDHLDELFHRIKSSGIDRWARINPRGIAARLRHRFAPAIGPERSFAIAEAHYDLGNDLFAAMLDRRMTYSCGYWQGANDLDAAQEAKLDLVCRKLGLRAGQRILDVGCGWGSFAAFAAQHYGARVTGITVSREQAELARQRCRGLPVEIRLDDYRALDEPFDHMVSIGMFEHVQPASYRTFFAAMARCLKPGGIFLLHTIGSQRLAFDSDPWLRKYVFPLGMIPVPRQIRAASRRLFHVLDWHALGSDHYDRTLMAWHANFTARWEQLAPAYAAKLQGGFERMWRYYLLSCAGVFRAGDLDVWQIAMAREALPYQPSR
jgi:cyclopropane-fatty-acyl-phospholipid synthase